MPNQFSMSSVPVRKIDYWLGDSEVFSVCFARTFIAFLRQAQQRFEFLMNPSPKSVVTHSLSFSHQVQVAESCQSVSETFIFIPCEWLIELQAEDRKEMRRQHHMLFEFTCLNNSGPAGGVLTHSQRVAGKSSFQNSVSNKHKSLSQDRLGEKRWNK